MRHSEVSLLLGKQIPNTKVVGALELMLKALKQPDPSFKRVTHD
jgi:hypothetical protein